MTKALYSTFLGDIEIECNGETLTRLDFVQPQQISTKYCRSVFSDFVFDQIEDYLAGRRRVFDVPICLVGTNFQQQVWQALTKIPFGETRSYGQIAAEVGNSKAARAVGMAVHKNPIAIIVPCHRVIGANGALVGYAAGLSIKKSLLKIENVGNVYV